MKNKAPPTVSRRSLKQCFYSLSKSILRDLDPERDNKTFSKQYNAQAQVNFFLSFALSITKIIIDDGPDVFVDRRRMSDSNLVYLN
jgi:hypothetical protein